MSAFETAVTSHGLALLIYDSMDYSWPLARLSANISWTLYTAGNTDLHVGQHQEFSLWERERELYFPQQKNIRQKNNNNNCVEGCQKG